MIPELLLHHHHHHHPHIQPFVQHGQVISKSGGEALGVLILILLGCWIWSVLARPSY